MNRPKLWVLLFLALLATIACAQTADREFQQQYQAAGRFFSAGSYSAAVQILTELRRTYPQSREAYDLLRQSYFKLKNYSAGEKLASEWVNSFPQDYLAWADLGESQIAQGKNREAGASFENALSLAEDKTLVYVRIAGAYLNSGEPDKAVQVYLTARKKSGTPYLFARELAHIYSSQGEISSALKEFFNYYGEDPQRAGEIEEQARELFGRDEATALNVEKFLKSRAASFPKDKLVFRLLAEVYLARSEQIPAVEAYRKLDQLEKAQGRVIFAFVQKCLGLGFLEGASRGIDFLWQDYPQTKSDPQVWLALVEVYRRQEKYESAQTALDQLLNLNLSDSDQAQVLLLAGRISFDEKDFVKSIEYLRRISQPGLHPALTQSRESLLGDAFLALAEPDSALYCYRKLQGEHLAPPQDEQLLFKLGELFFFTQNFDSAQSYYNQLVKKSVQSPWANDALERIRVINENQANDKAALERLSQAQWLVWQGKSQEALEELEKLTGSKSSLGELAYLEKARLYESGKEYALSLSSLKTLAEKYPQGYYAPLALMLSADIYSQRLGEEAPALELYQRVLKDFPRVYFIDRVRQRIKELSRKPESS